MRHLCQLPSGPALFFGMILAFQAVKPAWAAIENEVLDSASCIAPYQFIELQDQDTGTVQDSYGSRSAVLGMYERISPDGRFVLRSFSGRKLGDVALIELPASSAQPLAAVVRTFRTPLQNEAFPVQGSWRYLVNPDGSHYVFADVLARQQKAQRVFKGGMTGFYAAAAELPASAADPADVVQIRSLSWPLGDGLDTQGQGSLTARTISVNTRTQRIVHDSGRVNLCGERRKQDGSVYALPMISVDGLEFSAMPQMPVQGQPLMRIFSFTSSGRGCVLHDSFAQASSKTIFGYPRADAPPSGQGGDLAYMYRGKIYWYSRALQQAFALTPPLPPGAAGRGEGVATAFPGITRDGRIIYGATWSDCSSKPCRQRVGYVVADPYQLPAVRARLTTASSAQKPTRLPACISPVEVLAERAAFAQARQLPD